MGVLARMFKRESVKLERASRRRPLTAKVTIFGRDEYGSGFRDVAEMVNISTGGGCLSCNHDLMETSQLKLRASNGSTFVVKVRWCQYRMIEDRRYVGFQVLEPARGWLDWIHENTAFLMMR